MITFFAKNSLPRIVFTVIVRVLLAINFAINPLIYIHPFQIIEEHFKCLIVENDVKKSYNNGITIVFHARK